MMSSAIANDVDGLPPSVRERLVDVLRAAGAQKSVAARLGVSVPTLQRILAGSAPIDLNLLYRIAAMSGVDAPSLLSGRAGPNIVDASQADWIDIRTYDLRNITDDGKGVPVASAPFRRDWLNSAFGTDSGLWIAALLSGYPPVGLDEGDRVFLRDIRADELTERQLILWRVRGHLVVGRFSAALRATEPNGEYWVSPPLIGKAEDQLNPIARIMGRPLAVIR